MYSNNMDFKRVTDDEIPKQATRNQGGGRDWPEYAAVLMSDPGTWYELSDHGMTVAHLRVCGSRIRGGGLKPFRPAGAFEARTSGEKLWARYVGEGVAE